ncbi:hypothetical protein AMS68_000370 [Peltaster fructicola]|uniref:Uncharacterized protein n=1 Tax=Peltaster fructicola TaxID=286661 RepID=A0A6H0XJE7_9PEZI|nr:hypothetical protein AMS68_000370 [Peltaster fructicola]
MEDTPSPFGRKRQRDGEDWLPHDGHPVDKKLRPTTVQSSGEESLWFPRDSVIGSSQHVYTEHAKYDSDDQSSLVSEPGSPQPLSHVSDEDVSMHSDDEVASFPQRLDTPLEATPSRPWRSQLRVERAPTPVLSPKLGQRLLSSHVRSRHPQENISSDRLEVPSPIDEDEIPTPPSAAEAAGSQLELLTVRDIEMTSDDAPSIAVQAERSFQLDGSFDQNSMDTLPDPGFLRGKTRARSGALSGGDSPMRESPGPDGLHSRKGFSMGFRADCEKCQQKVPGHMNHFY